MATVVLVQGGFWQDVDGEFFWGRTGVVAGLVEAGVDVVAPDRVRRPPGWGAEVGVLARALPAEPAVVVGGSYGCSAAVRVTLAHPDRVSRLLLAWPGTAGDPEVDARSRERLAGLGAPPEVIEALLGGDTLRGVTDAELAGLPMPVGVLPSVPENPSHQRRTVDRLLGVLPDAVELNGCPEPPVPGFAPHLAALVATIAGFAAGATR
ncbi:MAG: alpha/beta fold hydrolase [Mycobacteriales bacterium]